MRPAGVRRLAALFTIVLGAGVLPAAIKVRIVLNQAKPVRIEGLAVVTDPS